MGYGKIFNAFPITYDLTYYPSSGYPFTLQGINVV